MKRFLVLAFSLLGAFVFLTAAYDAVNLMLVCGSTGNVAYKMERFFSLTRSELDVETPIIGSSRACGNYVPSILGTNVFNYGINGSCIRETIFHLRYLCEHKRKGTVIVNLDPWGYAYWGESPAGGFAGDYRLAALRSEVRCLLPDGLLGHADWVPGIRFQGKLRSNLTYFLNARKGITQHIDSGAVLLKNSRTPEEWNVINAGVKPDRFVPPCGGMPGAECMAPDADRLASGAQSDERLTVVWVIAPCSSVYRNRFANPKELSDYARKLNDCRSNGIRNVVIDLYGSSEFTDSDFVDPTHLNLKGAEKFTRLLSERLAEL